LANSSCKARFVTLPQVTHRICGGGPSEIDEVFIFRHDDKSRLARPLKDVRIERPAQAE
jgi:hypothetical protein